VESLTSRGRPEDNPARTKGIRGGLDPLLGLQMLEEAAVRRMGDPLGEQPIGACLQSAQRHPESVRRERPLLAAGAHPQGCYQQPARLDSSG